MLGTTGGHDKGGWSFQLSDNMVHWEPPIPLAVDTFNHQGNTTTNSNAKGFTLYAYPSLIDPSSNRTNYDAVGKEGYLYLMGRETPLPQYTHPMSYYVSQSIVRARVVFE